LVLLSVGCAVAAVVAAATSAGALFTITVNDANDGTPVPAKCTSSGDCTLRAAIEAANAAGADTTITLPDANTVPNNPSASPVVGIQHLGSVTAPC
jgi:hypothetical protein